MHFQNYGLRMTCLDKCLKSNLSDYRLTVNMLNGPKNWFNLHDNTLSYFRSVSGK